MSSRQSTTESVAALIRKARQMHGWTVTEAAKKCGYSVQQWRNLESGEQRPNLNSLQRISESLEVDSLRLLNLWIVEGLDRPDSQSQKLADAVRQQLLGDEEAATSQRAKPRRQQIQKALERITMDLDHVTESCLIQILIEVANRFRAFRNELVLANRRAPLLRIRTPQEQKNKEKNLPLRDVIEVKQCPLGQQKEGLGFFATVLTVPPNMALLHMAAGEKDQSAGGIEFIALLNGKGTLLVQSHASKECKCEDVEEGTVAYYDGASNHGFVNLSKESVRIFIISIPHPIHSEQGRTCRFVEVKFGQTKTSGLPPTIIAAIDRITDSYEKQIG
ncbi:MAG: hypothetical protein FD138_1124 [Planctomycetota bacterium]|nr:MAG: hypothetical protein FD138_1124 [Planctomycetota bacterium]